MRDLYKIERQGLRQGILLAKPEILHAHWTYEWAMACLETGLPMLATTHDNGFQQLRFQKDLYPRLDALIYPVTSHQESALYNCCLPLLGEFSPSVSQDRDRSGS